MHNTRFSKVYRRLLQLNAKPFLCFTTLLFAFVFKTFAQEDTAKISFVSRIFPTTHSPRTATILSAVLPGAGQIYNKKYWKAPIVWAGLGTTGYLFVKNTGEFRDYKNAYLLESDSITGNEAPRFANMSKEQIKANIEVFRRNRDKSAAFFGVFYLLNLIDAAVDAHLFHFEVNDNISLQIHPYQAPINQPVYGLRLALNFK